MAEGGSQQSSYKMNLSNTRRRRMVFEDPGDGPVHVSSPIMSCSSSAEDPMPFTDSSDESDSAPTLLEEQPETTPSQAPPVEEEFLFENLSELAGELELFEPLYKDCDIKLIDALINLTLIYKKHKLPKIVLNEFIEHVNLMLPKGNIYPDTGYKFTTLVTKLSPKMDPPEVTYYCASCLHKYGSKDSKECPKCSAALSAVCVQNNVESSLRHMLENRGLHKLLELSDEQVTAPGVISDMKDGIISKLVKKNTVYDMNLIQNTDGFPYANSNNKQIWPNFLAISDVKPALRPKYIVLAGFWFSPMKANLIKFLTPFASQLRKLDLDGFEWKHPTKNIPIKSYVTVIATCLDAQARAPALSMNYYNSVYGCSFCEIKGSSTPLLTATRTAVPVARKRGKTTVHVYPYPKDPPTKRTHDKVLSLQKKMYERKRNNIEDPKHEMGVQSLSPFSMLPNFDLVNSVSPDYLHSCLIGVVKRWTKHILNSKNSAKSYYIGTKSMLVDVRIQKLNFPSFVNRPPRNLSLLSFWKASEFRNWLFFVSLPCLKDILPDKYLEHHSLLVEAIYTLCKAKITFFEIQRCKQLIELYCSKYSELYGAKEMTFNLHMLLHYTSSVEHLGPLWAHSTFMFENANGLMRSSIHGTQNVAAELINTCKIHNALHILNHIKDVGDSVLSNVAHQRINLLRPELNLGALRNSTLTQFVNQFINSLHLHVRTYILYARCRINNTIYTSDSYSRELKTRSNYIAYKVSSAQLENDYAQVVAYLFVDQKKYFIGKKIQVLGPAFIGLDDYEVRHLKKYLVSSELVCIEVKFIKYPLYLVLEYFSEPPNMHEINL